MSTPSVALDTAKALLLADALAAAATDLAERSRRAAALLVEHGDELGSAIALARAGTGFATEAVRLQRLVLEVRSWQAAGTLPPRVQVLRGSVAPSHRDPTAAHDAALATVARYRRGDVSAFLGASRDWEGDPVFATTVLTVIGADGVVESLDHLGASWSLPGDDPERLHHTAIAGVLASLLATTTTHGAAAISPAQLVDAAAERHASLGSLGLLFVGDDRWSPDFLIDLVGRVLLPLNRDVLATGLTDDCFFGVAGDSVDGRVLLLAEVAGSEAAVLGLPTLGDLSALVDIDVTYGDGGRALAGVVATATTQSGTTPLAALAPVVTALVSAVGRVDEIAAPVAEAFATQAAWWVASLGSSDFDGRNLADPLPELTPDGAFAFLERVMVHAEAAADVRAATLIWVLAQVAAIGPEPDPMVAAHLGDVWRAVTDGEVAAAVDAAADEDAQIEAERYAIGLAVSAVSGLPTLGGQATSLALAGGSTLAGGSLGTLLSGEADHELEYLRDLPALLVAEQQALAHLVLAMLWEQRADNAFFAPAGVTPEPRGQATAIPAALLDRAGRLRPWASLDDADRRLFGTWRNDQRAMLATAIYLIDLAGVEYAESAQPAQDE